MAFLQQPSTRNMTDPAANPPPTSSQSHSLTSPRSRKQLTLFLAGASFLTLSTLITRRALSRRHLANLPRFYHPSHRPPTPPINGALEAFEALNIASVNVASFVLMMTGGAAWALDVSSVEDLRRVVRGGLGVDGSGRGERDVEEEFEEWVAGVLERKRGKEERRKGGGGGGGGEE